MVGGILLRLRSGRRYRVSPGETVTCIVSSPIRWMMFWQGADFGGSYEYRLRQLQFTVGGRRPDMRTQHLGLLESAQSRWVRAEATLADRNRLLVPAMIEPCDRPIMFELTHTADLSRWTGDASDRSWQGFLADVRRSVEAGGARPSEATSPQVVS